MNEKDEQRLLEDLRWDKEEQVGIAKGLSRSVHRVGREIDRLATKVKTCNVVTGISGVVSFFTTLGLAGASDFNDRFRTGVDVFSSQQGHTLLAVAGITGAVAGLSALVSRHYALKHDAKVDVYNEKYDKLEETEENIADINSQILDIKQARRDREERSQAGEEFLKNYMKETQDLFGNPNQPTVKDDVTAKEATSQEEVNQDEQEIDIILDHFKNIYNKDQQTNAPMGQGQDDNGPTE